MQTTARLPETQSATEKWLEENINDYLQNPTPEKVRAIKSIIGQIIHPRDASKNHLLLLVKMRDEFLRKLTQEVSNQNLIRPHNQSAQQLSYFLEGLSGAFFGGYCSSTLFGYSFIPASVQKWTAMTLGWAMGIVLSEIILLLTDYINIRTDKRCSQLEDWIEVAKQAAVKRGISEEDIKAMVTDPDGVISNILLSGSPLARLTGPRQ